jgi:putative sigma-54 modulation protein
MKPNHDVNIELRSRDESITDSLRDYAIDKARRLTRFHDRISRIQIIAEEVRHAPVVEIIVHVDSGSTFVAKEQSSSFRAAIDVLLGKIERQLKKDKERLKDHKQHGRPAGTREPTDEDESYGDAVRKDLGGR